MGARAGRAAVALFGPVYYLPYLDGIAKRYNKILWISHEKTGPDGYQSR
jgi:hypothetical protein